MTKKQLGALRRILDREAAAYQVRSGRPVPGQHPSKDKFAICDGDICILLNEPLPEFPVGERVDSLARIVQNERKGGTHFPVPENQIVRSRWTRQIKRCRDQLHGVELSAPTFRPDQLTLDDAGTPEVPSEIVGKFAPQLLIDAVEAIGDQQTLFFLGFGPVQQSLSKSPRDATRLDRIQLYQTHCSGISLTSITERSAVAYQELPTKKFSSSSSGKCE